MMAHPLRIAVTGRHGQVVSSLIARAGDSFIVPLARPDFDLANIPTIASAIKRAEPDVIVSAAAYTAVDRAEDEPELAFAVNATGIEEVARNAAELNIPLIHLSTDYVFSGSKKTPYFETDETGPLGVYGTSKLAGETAVSSVHENHAILRTAWVYSPFGSNFLKTMLCVAATRDTLNVVDDQIGNPTNAFDIADAIFKVADNLVNNPRQANMRGIFHMTGSGSASWAEFATQIFEISARLDGPSAQVIKIPSSQYPTPTPRPANSQLNCEKLVRIHAVELPNWQTSTERVISTLKNAE